MDTFDLEQKFLHEAKNSRIRDVVREMDKYSSRFNKGQERVRMLQGRCKHPSVNTHIVDSMSVDVCFDCGMLMSEPAEVAATPSQLGEVPQITQVVHGQLGHVSDDREEE